ncbi:MAG: hypothetical protein IPI57_12120 [Candidatus Competibacteraceae bacterium]|nr:hypothetical protein [Candidatus Competibacteraceae bacterium]
MRRYGSTSDGLTVPGQNAGLKLTLQPAPPEPAPACAPAPTGLYWFSDSTGDFTEPTEAAYLSSAEAAGPVLAVARVIGETCGDVVWAHDWTPDAGTGGAPGVIGNGADCLVYPVLGGGPGQLSVSAECAGQSLGPILLTLLPAPGGGADCCPAPVAGAGQMVWSPGRLVYVFPIVGSHLNAETESGGIETVWSVDYVGDDPGGLALVGSVLAGTLALGDIDDGAHQTAITVTAALAWTCRDGPHDAALTWTLEFSYH